MSLEKYFSSFRNQIIGQDQFFESPFGKKRILYADWIASGRLYHPIEELFQNEIFPFTGNTHTETSVTGSTMNLAFHQALIKIKDYVGANEDDIIISGGAGMTMLINKFQRMLGIKIHEKYKSSIELNNRPIIFVTHMEHHSNQTTWIETIADVKIIPHTDEGFVDLQKFKEMIVNYQDRDFKAAAITSCSNVTGIFTPYHEIAEIMHKNDGYCFVDFACSAPYIDINMHPKKHLQYLDAIYFSPHKFLGGPGSTGILIFNKKLYKNNVPDMPGGGTVDWTNPWGEHKYVDDIESREDGGTPAFLQTIKTYLCMKLKEEMGVKNILNREHEMHNLFWNRLLSFKNLHVLAKQIENRLCIYSFYIENLHYNLAVRMLNDRFGIQTRGGCSCAGTYGHFLLNVSQKYSKDITNKINEGDLTIKPGWVRLSLHPTMTDSEIFYILESIKELCKSHVIWAEDYEYSPKTNEFYYKNQDFSNLESRRVSSWFDKELK